MWPPTRQSKKDFEETKATADFRPRIYNRHKIDNCVHQSSFRRAQNKNALFIRFVWEWDWVSVELTRPDGQNKIVLASAGFISLDSPGNSILRQLETLAEFSAMWGVTYPGIFTLSTLWYIQEKVSLNSYWCLKLAPLETLPLSSSRHFEPIKVLVPKITVKVWNTILTRASIVPATGEVKTRAKLCDTSWHHDSTQVRPSSRVSYYNLSVT